MEMNTAGRVSRVGAGRRRLGWAPGFGRHGRTALSSSPRTRGSSGSFWGGWRVDSSSAQSGCIKIHLRRRHPGRAISSCSWTRPSTTPRLRGCSAGSFIVTRTRCLLNSRGVSSRCRVVPACGVLEDGLESRPSPLAQRGRVQTPPLTDSGLERSSWGALPVGDLRALSRRDHPPVGGCPW